MTDLKTLFSFLDYLQLLTACQYPNLLVLYVIIMSRRRFRVNLLSVIAWMSGTPCSKQARYLKFKWQEPLNQSSITWPVWLNSWVYLYELKGCGFESRCCHLNFRYRARFEQGVPDIQANIECRFTLKRVRDMIITYDQIHRTYKYSQHSSILWPVWLNGWVIVYKLSGCGFVSCYCRLSKYVIVIF